VNEKHRVRFHARVDFEIRMYREFIWKFWIFLSSEVWYPPYHLFLDSAPNIGPLISRWQLDTFKNCWNKSFRASKILTLLYQQFSNLSISQRGTSGPRLGALSNNRWSVGTIRVGFKDCPRRFWSNNVRERRRNGAAKSRFEKKPSLFLANRVNVFEVSRTRGLRYFLESEEG
jgi:hypothetical protein